MNTRSESNCVSVERLSFPIARFRLRFVENAQRKLLVHKDYLGSAWRGAFGHALKQTVCITNLPSCDSCSLLESCPYPNLFEVRPPLTARKLSRYPRIPVPYVLEPCDPIFDSRNATYNLGLILFGSAINNFQYVVRALQIAGQRGLTNLRIKLDLQDVQIETGNYDDTGWKTVHTAGKFLTLPTIEKKGAPPNLPSQVRIHLISPLRIRYQEQLVSATDFVFRAFAASLLRRISLLTYFFTDKPLEIDFAATLKIAESIPIVDNQLRWHDWARRSSRQDSKLLMGGLVGSLILNHDELESFFPYLWLGQWTHVGKGCTMGLGRYAVEPTEASSSAKYDKKLRNTPMRL